MKTLHRDMGEFECGFSDIHSGHHHKETGGGPHKVAPQPTSAASATTSCLNESTTGLSKHDQLSSTSSGWKRREKRSTKGGGGSGSEGKHIHCIGESADEEEEEEDVDDDEEEEEDDDEVNGDFINSDEDHHSSSNHHVRYSYGKTFSILYDRLWSIVRSAFKKEHKLDQMELFNEACAARLAANYTANKSRRRRELEILCKKTKFTRNELKLLYWGWKCACPNGILTESTFKEIYAQFFPQAGDSTLYAHYVYSAMFNDKVRTANGEVTFSDYASALSTLSRGSTADKLEWIFKLYDINGDGYLTADEIIEISRAIYALLGYYVSPGHDSKTCEDHGYRVFQKLDTQSKGYITFDEFLQVCSKDETIISSMQLLDTIGLD